jgi:hypothetical protein
MKLVSKGVLWERRKACQAGLLQPSRKKPKAWDMDWEGALTYSMCTAGNSDAADPSIE